MNDGSPHHDEKAQDVRFAGDNRFVELLDLTCNGIATEAERQELSELLVADPTKREQYVLRMGTEAELYALHAGHPLPVVAEGVAAEALEPAVSKTVMVKPMPAKAGFDSVGPTSVELAEGRRSLVPSLVIAASLTGVALFASLATLAASKLLVKPTPGVELAEAAPLRPLAKPGPLAPPAAVPQEAVVAQTPSAPASEAIARISATRNCRWQSLSASAGYGQRLQPGQRLDLAAGLAEITFDGGAQIVLEGPASLELRNATDTVLINGRLAATIPPHAKKIGLRTVRFGVAGRDQQGHAGDRDSLRDAEFGLYADGQGGGELHVFRGLIRAELLDQQGMAIRTLDLNPAEAARLKPAATTLAKFHAQNDKFVRSIYSSGGPHDGLYSYDGFDYPISPLSWQNGGFGWAGPWADIEADDTEGEMATNQVADESLAYLDMAGLGGRAAQTAQRNRIRRVLSTSLGGVFDTAGLVENRDGHRLVGKEGKRVYISFLQQTSKTNDVFYGFELNRGDGNGNRVLCVGNGADGAGYGVTSNYNIYGPSNYPSLGDENTEVNFIVIRIDFGRDDRDEVTVYRNPTSLLDETMQKSMARLRGNFAFDRVSLGNFDGTKVHSIDEIRIGTTYRSVTGQRDNTSDNLVRASGPI